LLFVTGTRLLVISNYDTTTATTVASAMGAVSTFLGTIIPLLPSFLPLLILVFLVARKFIPAIFVAVATAFVSPKYASPSEARHEAWIRLEAVKRLADEYADYLIGHRNEWSKVPRLPYQAWQHRDQGLATLNQLWTYLLHDWRWQSLSYAGLALLLARRSGKEWATKQDFARSFVGSYRTTLHPIVMALVCFLSINALEPMYRVPHDWRTVGYIAHQPWIPAEVVTLKSGPPHAGYVLSTKDGWLVLLKEPERTIEYIPADTVRAREVCTAFSLQDGKTLPLIEIHGVSHAAVGQCPRPGSAN
jgi:hypothetical protein